MVATAATNAADGIQPGQVLTIEQCKQRLGIGRWAWYHSVRPRLKTIKMGRRVYVRTDDVIELFDSLAAEQNSGGAT